MAFVVEDDTGLANANAICSVAFCDDYHSDRGNAGWTGTTTAKEQAIVRATDYMERRWGKCLLGYKEFPETQALSFPRTYLYTRDGYLIDGTPTNWKQACAEYALRALTAELYPDPTADDSLVLDRKKIGPIETEKKWSDTGGVTDLPEYPTADALVEEYVVCTSGRSYRA